MTRGLSCLGQADSSLFGPKDSCRPDPHSFLRKGSKTSATSTLRGSNESRAFSYSGPRRPAVPSKNEQPILGLRTNKNFITANAVETILQGELGVRLCAFEPSSF